jgi:DNA-binding XRE family transcriptional regulator
VKVRRLQADLTRAELGARAAVSAHRIGQIEAGRSMATLDIWVRLAGTLPASLDELLEGVTWKLMPFVEELGEGAYIAKPKEVDGD